MKRVALFPSAFHPSLGGVEELTGQLAVHLKKHGIGALICVNQWPRDLPAVERWRGFAVRRFPFRLPEYGLKSKISFYLSRHRVMRSVVGALERFHADAVHVQCMSSNAWYACGAAAALNLPLIVSIQGERTMDAQGIYGKSPLYNRILRSVLRQADQITACSAATLADIESFMGGSLGQKAKVVYNGVGSEAFEEGPKWAHPRPYILALGRLVSQKGFGALLEAYASANVRSTDLLIAGDGPIAGSLKAAAERLGLSERVYFTGRAARAEVQALLRGCRGVVVPSLREPMGIVALEGMAAGKPLLVSAVDGLKEIAMEGPWCRHAPPGDVVALSRGLQWLESLGVEAGAQAQREHAKKFLWERLVGDYLNIYTTAAEGFEKKFRVGKTVGQCAI
jgi:glycosyltransferase involved in cell wall biosynthesis